MSQCDGTMSDVKGYGANPFALWYCGLRDRLEGRSHRARARWGYLKAPEGPGKLIWLRAGATERSVRLAVEVAAALREKRRDVRLIVTFHVEYPEILASRLGELAKTGFGYGSADAPKAVHRALDRLNPLGVISVDAAPGKHFQRALIERKIHSVQLQGVCTSDVALEAYYPSLLEANEPQHASYVAPAVDLLTLIIPSQVDPVFGSLLKGNACTDMWWVHAPANGKAWLQAWQSSPLYANSVLCVSEASPEFDAQARSLGVMPIRASEWTRDAVPPGSVWIVDEARWLPALAASVSGVCLMAPEDRETYWQVLAGGAPLLPEFACEPNAALAAWIALQADPPQARKSRDLARRLFWEERRKATSVLEEFLQRVYDW